MNHVMLTDRELAAVVRALDEPDHRMTDGFRQKLQAKIRAARSAGRRVKAPRVLAHVHAVYGTDGECVDITINTLRFSLRKGQRVYAGWFVPDLSAEPLGNV